MMGLASVTVAVLLTAGVLSRASAGGVVPPFQLADRDGNGFIDQEEGRRAGLSAERFREADTNGDARLMPWEYRRVEEAAIPTRGTQSHESGGRENGDP